MLLSSTIIAMEIKVCVQNYSGTSYKNGRGKEFIQTAIEISIEMTLSEPHACSLVRLCTYKVYPTYKVYYSGQILCILVKSMYCAMLCVLWALAFMATYLGFLGALPARTMQDRQARLFADSWCGKHTPWIRLVMQETCHTWPNYVIFMVALECNKLCNIGMDWVCAWVCSCSWSFNMINGCMWVWYVLLWLLVSTTILISVHCFVVALFLHTTFEYPVHILLHMDNLHKHYNFTKIWWKRPWMHKQSISGPVFLLPCSLGIRGYYNTWCDLAKEIQFWKFMGGST